jgi:hypothetical protein
MSYDDTGSASGYSVEEDEDGSFSWSAFGPRGARRGFADTREGAEQAARAAEEELADPAAGP